MNRTRSLLVAPLLMAAAFTAVPSASHAQLFGRDGLFSRDPEPQQRQTIEPDEDPQRVERLENMVRQLTGQNEQLQFKVRQLEEQLRAQGAGGAQQPAPVAQTAPAQQPPQQTYQQPQAAAPPPVRQQQAINQPPPAQVAPIDQPAVGPRGGRRNDAFDPNQNPGAPGAPRALGGGQMPVSSDAQVGAPGGRDAGQPLDINRGQPSAAPAPGAQASLTTAPPSGSPRDEFDLGIGYIQRKDYALAEETMRNFAQKYPNDRLVADAQYWLGESQFQRQQYNDAAESFLAVTSKYGSSGKAPDSLLRLGQSLAALKQKEAACAAYGEVGRKYPKASNGVKQGVDREQKRIGC